MKNKANFWPVFFITLVIGGTLIYGYHKLNPVAGQPTQQPRTDTAHFTVDDKGRITSRDSLNDSLPASAISGIIVGGLGAIEMDSFGIPVRDTVKTPGWSYGMVTYDSFTSVGRYTIVDWPQTRKVQALLRKDDTVWFLDMKPGMIIRDTFIDGIRRYTMVNWSKSWGKRKGKEELPIARDFDSLVKKHPKTWPFFTPTEDLPGTPPKPPVRR